MFSMAELDARRTQVLETPQNRIQPTYNVLCWIWEPLICQSTVPSKPTIQRRSPKISSPEEITNIKGATANMYLRIKQFKTPSYSSEYTTKCDRMVEDIAENVAVAAFGIG